MNIACNRISRTNNIPKPAVLWLFALLANLLATSAPALAQSVLPNGWSAELTEAFGAYRAAQYAEVARICREIASTNRSPAVRRDAEALAAMALLRTSGRTDRLSGRSRLMSVAQDEPRMELRPDCRLALGIASVALDELAIAIRELSFAARDLESTRRYDALPDCYVALADAWSRNNEWDLTLPDRALPRPNSTADAARVRVAEVARVRELVAALPQDASAAAALEKIDLIVARNALADASTHDAALAALRQISGRDPTGEASAEAMLLLANDALDHHDEDAAVRLLRQVVASGVRGAVEQAERVLLTVANPSVTISVAIDPRPSESFQIIVAARLVRALSIEIRKVDFVAWLNANQGRPLEPKLAEDGAVSFSAELDPSAKSPHTLTLALPGGAYAVIARGSTDRGEPYVAKRLLAVSGLQATAVAGLHTLEALAPDCAEGSARLWLHGSFVPVEAPLRSGVARLTYPPEVRRLRDRRWTLLLESGGKIAVCRGETPLGADDPTRPVGALIIGGPAAPRSGEEITLAGIVRRAGGNSEAPRQVLEYQLQLANTMDRSVASVRVNPDISGAFAATIPVTPDMSGETLRPLIRAGERVLETIVVTPEFRPAAPRRVELTAESIMPPGAAGMIRGQVRARYGWGTPLGGASVQAHYHATLLPTPATEFRSRALPIIVNRTRLDAAGKSDFLLPMGSFGDVPGPIAVSARFDIVGFDRRMATRASQTLIGGDAIHAWIIPRSSELRVGESTTIEIGWFDPRCLASGQYPTLTARPAAGGEATALTVGPHRPGWFADDWTPVVEGEHILTLTLPRAAGDAHVTERRVQVMPAPRAVEPASVKLTGASGQLQREDQRCFARVTLSGTRGSPVWVGIVGADVVASRWLEPGNQTVETRLGPLPGPPHTLRWSAATFVDGRFVSLAGGPLQADVGVPSLELKSEGIATPGAVLRETLRRADGAPLRGATVIARISDTQYPGSVDWMPIISTSDTTPAQPGLVLTHATALAPSPGEPRSERLLPNADRISAGERTALCAGETSWISAEPIRGDTHRLALPIPARPGKYRLDVLVYEPDGSVSTAFKFIDAARKSTLAADIADNWVLGDRTVIALSVQNLTNSEMTGELSVDAGTGLSVADFRSLSHAASVEPTASADAIRTARVRIAAGASATLVATAEAARTGRAAAKFEWRAASETTTVVSGYRVSAPETSATPTESGISIRRAIFRLDPTQRMGLGTEYDTGGPAELPTERDLPRIPVTDGDTIAAGTLLLIEESVDVREPLDQFTWEQAAASHTATRTDDRSIWVQIGSAMATMPDELTFRGSNLAIGARRHEYVLVALRPGTAEIPPPVIRNQKRRIPVSLTGDSRIRIAE